MEYHNDCVGNIKIAYIGGGSRGWAWSLMKDLALEASLSGTVKLYDLDYEAAAANQQIGNRLTAAADTKGKWNYVAVKALKEALRDANFIIISILPGTFAEMASDVHTPEKYGIYQSVGDSVGPGGLFRALRTIPMYEVIATAIEKYASDAWVINYTNPMSLCTRTLYQVFPKIKAFGCCHEVFGTQKLLVKMLRDLKGITGVTRDDIHANVAGINHFTWIDKASYRGMDLFPLYREFVAKYYETGYEGGGGGNWLNDSFASAQRVKFDLFKRYGLIAAAGDRHLAEFLPPWYLKDPETVRFWKFGLTTVAWRIEHQKELIAKSQRLVAGTENLVLDQSGEEGVRQIKAILGLGNLVTNVNLPNRGQMGDVPVGAIVETNACFSGDSIQPILTKKLPAPIQALVLRQVVNQETILRAGLNRDRHLAFQAFLNDPLVTIQPDQAELLFNEMLQNTKSYLPGWGL